MNRTGISKIKRVHYKFVRGTLVSQESIETVSNAAFETDANEQWRTNVYVIGGGATTKSPGNGHFRVFRTAFRAVLFNI